MSDYYAATVTRCNSRANFGACPCCGYSAAGEPFGVCPCCCYSATAGSPFRHRLSLLCVHTRRAANYTVTSEKTSWLYLQILSLRKHALDSNSIVLLIKEEMEYEVFPFSLIHKNHSLWCLMHYHPYQMHCSKVQGYTIFLIWYRFLATTFLDG